MRLLVDDRWVGRHGIGRFAKEIIRRLPSAHAMPRGVAPTSPLDPLWTSLQIARIRPSVYFTPGYNAPIYSRSPFLITIHDLIHLRVAGEGSAAIRIYYEHIVRPALFKAYGVLTVSDFSKQEITAWSGVPAENIVVVGNGVSSGFAPIGPRHAEDRPYLLYIGNRKPHKNLARLLRAFRLARIDRDVILLCSGVRDAAIEHWIQEAGLKETAVRFAGEIPENRLPGYYRGALAVLIPSLYEGFGLPALEAMACGTPVLAGNRTALPEIIAQAGLLVDPENVEALSDGIRRIVDDNELRDRLKSLGPKTAARFNWEETSKRVQRILDAAAEGRNQ